MIIGLAKSKRAGADRPCVAMSYTSVSRARPMAANMS